jgi:hypothetical protein
MSPCKCGCPIDKHMGGDRLSMECFTAIICWDCYTICRCEPAEGWTMGDLRAAIANKYKHAEAK